MNHDKQEQSMGLQEIRLGLDDLVQRGARQVIQQVIGSELAQPLPFDIIRDLVPVTTVTYSQYLLTTHPSVPVKNVAELVALAKKSPGKLNAPVGLGSAIHLSTLAMQQRVGANRTYIPTKGGQNSVMSVMTGDGDFLFMGVIQTWVRVRRIFRCGRLLSDVENFRRRPKRAA